MDHRQIAAMVLALLDTIDETPEGVPSGVAYAAFSTKGADRRLYQAMVDTLVKAEMIESKGHLLTIAPKGHELIVKARQAVAARAA